MLYGAPKHLVAKLQNFQNATARIIVGLGKQDHITPVLKDHYWLPVEQRIVYKINLLTFKSIHGLAPKYLQDLLDVYKPNRPLLFSIDSTSLNLPRYDMNTVTFKEL